MELGDRVKRVPETFGLSEHTGPGARPALTGTVVYIHPKGRYHTVEFQTPGGPVQECFEGVEK